MPRVRFLIGALLLLLVVTACGGGAGSPTSAPASASLATTTTAVPSTTAEAMTTTLADDAAPPELAGLWRTERDDRLSLRLSGTSYTLSSAVGSSTGDISVEGDRITFSNCDCPDPACEDPGTYQWLIEEDTLTITVADPADPCSGRRTRLAGVAFTR